MEQTKGWYRSGKALLEQMKKGCVSPRELSLWYLGQAGFALALGGQRVLLDPVFADMKDQSGASRRNYPAPFEAKDAAFADWIFCTHDHGDHLNLDTLLPIAKAQPTTVFVVPEPAWEKVVEAGLSADKIIGAKAGEPIIMGQLCCTPVPAAHESYETDSQGNFCCLGYHFSFADHFGPSLYHCGDTVLTRRLVDDLRALGKLDVLLAPINGADLKRREQGIIGNMNPREAADLSQMVGAELTIPYHYDMIMGNTENPLAFASAMERWYPDQPYQIPRLGERILYRRE